MKRHKLSANFLFGAVHLQPPCLHPLGDSAAFFTMLLVSTNSTPLCPLVPTSIHLYTLDHRLLLTSERCIIKPHLCTAAHVTTSYSICPGHPKKTVVGGCDRTLISHGCCSGSRKHGCEYVAASSPFSLVTEVNPTVVDVG